MSLETSGGSIVTNCWSSHYKRNKKYLDAAWCWK